MEHISKKEWILGIAITFVVVAISVLMYQTIQLALLNNVKLYNQALKINNSEEEFLYAINTNVGTTLSYGTFSAVEPQSISELIGEFSYIGKTKEEYCIHVDQVCTTDSDGDLSCRTEISYSWDSKGKEHLETNLYMFLGNQFSQETLSMPFNIRYNLNPDLVAPEYHKLLHNSYIYEEERGWGTSVGDIRYKYNIIPQNFNASLFARFYENKILNPKKENRELEVYYEKTIEEVMLQQEKDIKVFTIIYFIVSILIGISLYLFLSYRVLNL